MFKIYDGREAFFQWDLNQKLIVEDASVTEVHFCNRTDDCSLVCEVYAIPEAGLRVVDVPNILLQDNWTINAYAYCGDCYTKQAAAFKVIARTKPADYVYTETEIKTWGTLEEKITEIEMNMAVMSSSIDTALMDSQMAMSMVSNSVQREEVEQNFNSSSENPISGAGVGEAYFALENMYNELASSQLKWKTVLNTTLTEAQAGATSALIAIDDVESFANAKQIRIYVSMPQETNLKANDFWFTIIIRDEKASTYNRHLIGGYNTAGSSKLNLESYAVVDVINAGATGTSYKRSYTSVGILPNPHRNAPANSSSNAKIIAGGWHSANDFKKYPPYVQINASTELGVFRAGTKVYVEVLV